LLGWNIDSSEERITVKDLEVLGSIIFNGDSENNNLSETAMAAVNAVEAKITKL